MIDNIYDLAQYVKEKGGTLYVVGGLLRDFAMNGFEITTEAILQHSEYGTDIDLALEGLDIEDIAKVCPTTPIFTGNSPVYLVTLGNISGAATYELALTRREINTGVGTNMVKFERANIVEDMYRRDFTINSMAFDLAAGILIDPTGMGYQDAKDRILRITDPQNFSQSIERCMRAFAIIAITGVHPIEETVNVCRDMYHQYRKELPVEQLWRQGFGKVAKRGVYINEAVLFLIKSDWYRTLPLCNLARLKESWERIAEKRMAFDNPFPPSQLEELYLAAIVDAAEPKLSVRAIADMVGYGMSDMDGEMGRKHVLSKIQLFFDANFDAPAPIVANMVHPHSIHSMRHLLSLFAKPRTVAKILHEARLASVMHERQRPFVSGDDLLEIGYKTGKPLGKVIQLLYSQQLQGKLTSRDDALAVAESVLMDVSKAR